MKKNFATYDFETLSNCFTAVFKDLKTGVIKKFVFHDLRDDFLSFIKFLKLLKKNDYWLIGFNALAFDGQILEYINRNYEDLLDVSGSEAGVRIHGVAQEIIALPEEEKWLQLIPEWKLSFPHIDVFKQKHYDGKQKHCSLKWLQFTMRFSNIESMPFTHDSEITTEQEINDILSYNTNDVDSTEFLFKLMKFETDLRWKLSKKYDKNLMNASEPRLARDIFGIYLCREMNIPYRDLKTLRTYRKVVRVGQLIFKYIVFEDQMLQAVKRFFSRLNFNPYMTKEERDKEKGKYNKTFSYGNLKKVVVGLGGIHGCISNGIYEARPDHVIKDLDVSSYYPNLGIKNRLYPEHLSETFCDVYEGLYNERQTIPKEDPVNYVFKIILNSTYGLSMEMNNYFHDPNYTFSITVNGQLLLLMLAERLKKRVKGIVFYQFNTDGITIGYNPDQEEIVKKCTAEWEKLTQLKLEDKLYTKMVIRDVNNYLAVDTKGKVKRKGVFAYSLNPEDKELDYHKNPSALVIAKALEQFYVHGVPYEKYIKECHDIYDFCLGVKIKNNFDLVRYKFFKGESNVRSKVVHQQVVRYYVTTEPESLKKKYKPGSKKAGQRVELQKGFCTKYFNRYKKLPMKDYNIDYRYYIQAAREVVIDVSQHGSNLKLDL